MERSKKSFSSGALIRSLSNAMLKLLKINFLTLICCIPIITVGASLTAMYDCLLRMVRKEDVPIGRRYFQAFRENWKGATLLWLPFLLIFGGVLADVFVILTAPDALAVWVIVPAIAAGIVAFLIFQFVMPLQSHFENSFLGTLKSAGMLAVSNFPKTVLMALLWAAPVFLFLKFIPSIPLVVLFGFSLPGYLCMRLCDPIFQILEDNAAGLHTLD